MTAGSIFWLVVIAASGGVLVFVGLLMERFAEKDWHKNLSDFRHSKSRMVWGEWIVIAGIMVEIGVGIYSAVDAWQTRQMAIKNDPLNQPIASLTVSVFLEVLETNLTKIPDLEKMLPQNRMVLVYFGSSKHSPVSWSTSLICTSIKRVNSDRGVDWFFEVSQTGIGDNEMAYFWNQPLKEYIVRDANEWDLISVESHKFTPEGTEIAGGEVTLTVNSLKRKFSIPAQKVISQTDPRLPYSETIK